MVLEPAVASVPRVALLPFQSMESGMHAPGSPWPRGLSRARRPPRAEGVVIADPLAIRQSVGPDLHPCSGSVFVGAVAARQAEAQGATMAVRDEAIR